MCIIDSVGADLPVSGLTGTLVPYPGTSTSEQLGVYDGSKDVIITLPGSLKTTDIKWLNIWCVWFEANFGDVVFPEDIDQQKGNYFFTYKHQIHI